MNLAHPMALLWGLIALAVVALYLRAVRPRREAAGAGIFWDRVLAEGWFRQRWRRWREPASAAVQLAILALVVVALAEPRRSRPQQIVLVLVNAARATPGEPKPGPLPGAKETAARWIAGLNDYDEMAILSAAPTPTVSSGWSSDRARLRMALDAISPLDAAAEMPATLALAHWMTADRPGAKIVAFAGDGGTTAANPPEPRGPLWLYFAAAALALCAVEWCLYQRRWIS
jgi:hypothetical protein